MTAYTLKVSAADDKACQISTNRFQPVTTHIVRNSGSRHIRHHRTSAEAIHWQRSNRTCWGMVWKHSHLEKQRIAADRQTAALHVLYAVVQMPIYRRKLDAMTNHHRNLGQGKTSQRQEEPWVGIDIGAPQQRSIRHWQNVLIALCCFMFAAGYQARRSATQIDTPVSTHVPTRRSA